MMVKKSVSPNTTDSAPLVLYLVVSCISTLRYHSHMGAYKSTGSEVKCYISKSVSSHVSNNLRLVAYIFM